MKLSVEELLNKDPQAALEKSEEYILLSKKYLAQEHLANFLYLYAALHYLTGKNSDALEYSKMAIKFTKNIELNHKIHILLGAIYTYFGEFDKALEVYDFAIKTNNNSSTSTVYNNIAAIYFKQKNYNEAIQYLNKALELSDGNISLILLILNNIGRAYIELKDLENAEPILLKVIEILNETENPTQEMINSLNIGLLYYEQERYPEAYSKLFDAYVKCKELDLKNNLYSATLFLAHACTKNNKQDQANAYYLETLDLMRNLDNRLYIDALKSYLDFLVQQQDFERCTTFFIEYTELKELIIREDKEKEISALTVKFQNTEQKLEIDKLNKEKEFQKQLLAQAEEVKRTNEKLLEINQNLSDFSYALSHDIRTPIRQLAGFGSMIKNKNYAGKEELLKQDLNYIYDAAKKADTMIQELHKFALVGIQEDKFIDIDTNDALKDAIGNLSSLIADSQAQIDILHPLPILKGEKTLITQLFQNLLGNAIKYIQKEITPRIEIDYQLINDKKQITIKDNGIGIPVNEQKDVFKLFSRATNSGGIEGTGIGLSFCHKIISKMHAHIHLASEGTNLGTTVILEF
jgi:signal transduction histidine kinase/Tfp pilus assembly protein PilF